MTSDENPREKFIDLAARDLYLRQGIYEPGCPWEDLFDGEHRYWREAVTPTIDALAEMIAETWDDGWHSGYRADDYDAANNNPWRTPSTATPSSTDQQREQS